jgi:eukaryotic-like serine/threonine-protein kinase
LKLPLNCCKTASDRPAAECMPNEMSCSECGRPLPKGALDGVCPLCSLSNALKIDALSASFGDYELLELIARGGMGLVYKARQKSLDRIVALKMLLLGPQASPEFVKRFRAEACAAASLSHPNIVAIHEVGVHEGQHFFVMDYVAGPSLAQLISDSKSRILDSRRTARWLKTLAEAVHYAHERGILHRDLKPSNVLIDENDEPRITDFGLAKRLTLNAEDGVGSADLTVTGQVLGSPNYIPPEQASGKRGRLSRRSDVYALGAMLYHLLTGRPPFQGETLTDTLQQVLSTEPLPPRWLNPSAPPELETLCLKCLEKESARRYPTAQALAEELDRFLKGQPVLARPIGPAGKVWRWCRRQPVRAGLIAALIVVFAAGTAGVLWQWQRAERNAAGEARQREAALAAGVETEIREYDANIALAQSLIQTHQFSLARDILLARAPESYRGWEWGWLARSCNQDLMTLSGNPSLGAEAFFSPDSRFLVTSGFHPLIWIWDLATGHAVRSLGGHTGMAGMTPFSADGRRLCTFDWAGVHPTVQVWDMETGQTVFEPLVQPGGVRADLSRDGKRLVTACDDGKVRVYDASTGAETGMVNDYGDAALCAAFSPDGRRIAYAGGSWVWTRSQDTSVRIWDLTTGDTKHLEGHTQVVSGVAWSPDGALLVSCGAEGKIKAWDPDSGLELPPFEASPQQRVMIRAAFSPDGRLLGVVGGDVPNPTARATLFDVRTRRVVRELAGHSTMPQGISFSPDGQYVATSATAEGTVKIWPAAPVPAFVSLEGHYQTVWTAAFSPQGNRIATGSLDQTARIWDAETGALLQTFLVRFPVVSLAFSHDGARLTTVGPENTACVWKVETGEKAPEAWPGPSHLRGHSRAVLAVAWSPDDQWVATGSKDKTARIWNAATGVACLTLAGHEGSIRAIAFAPDGKLLATGSADGTARLWSTSSGQCLRVLTNHGGGVLSLAFSPKEHLLATGSGDGSARLWDTDTGRLVHLLSGHINGVSSVAFSPDGQRLVTTPGGSDLYANFTREMRVLFWDVASGRQLLALPAHDNAIYAATFDPGGSRLLTASGDNTVRIWSAFPWHSRDYPGDPNLPLATRLEEFKRHFWKSALANQRAADALARPWTNGFRVYQHTFGEMHLPPANSKTQPLFPIPPRPAQATPNHIDLSADYNVALNESWQPIGNITDVDRTLAGLPVGLQTFDGVPFDVRGLIQLRGAAPDSEVHPDRVVIPMKRAFTRLHALHAATWFERQGCTIGAFVLHYANGEVAELPILYGEHLRGEYPGQGAKSECPKGRLVWGPGSGADPTDTRPRLYQATFPNPTPAREVVQIDFISKGTRCAPLLVALTVE